MCFVHRYERCSTKSVAGWCDFMRIVIVSAYYSDGMGYTENCLPRALAALGHEVHVVTSTLNVYGNMPEYERTYQSFLGPAVQPARTYRSGNVTVHRLPFRLILGYVSICGLIDKVRQLGPDIVHCTEIASLQAFALATVRPMLRYRFFAETHQHMSVVKPFLKARGISLQKMGYWLTRTLPTKLACLALRRCYAIAPDCVEVAVRYFGVPRTKVCLKSLGTDTVLFRPASSEAELAERSRVRQSLGYDDEDIVCIYTGRFSADKNPLVLALAVERLAMTGQPFHSLFVGEGKQRAEIERCRNARVMPFAQYETLADLYRAMDIAVWPRQESMSMLDAAASGLPLIVSDTVGERGRVEGNGRFYRENDVSDLATQLLSLLPREQRHEAAVLGRAKMELQFSWAKIAQSIAEDYIEALAR